jgi:PAS domain S-box-containing protein
MYGREGPLAFPSENVESRLRESEERYRAVIENASDMIQSCRPDGSFEFVNNAWLEKLGYQADEVEHLKVWDIIHPDAMDHCLQAFGDAASGRSLEDVHATFISKDGRAIPVEGNATSRFVDGKVIATHSFFRDVSERVRSEQLERRNAELERERAARYFEKMAALGKLSAGLAHELNNPAAAAQRAASQLHQHIAELESLTVRLAQKGVCDSVWGHLQNARQTRLAAGDTPLSPLDRADHADALAEWLGAHSVEDAWEIAPGLVAAGFDEGELESLAADLPPDTLADALTWIGQSLAADELVETIVTSTRAISELVGAVKEYSYMDRAPVQEVDIHDGIESTVRILGHKLKDGTRLTRQFDRSLPRITVLAGELNQVWTNLLDNAIDAAGPDGEVRIRTFKDNVHLVVEVGDNGPGIPSEVGTRIFDPFYTTKDAGKGTGLGLDVTRRIVTERCGGEIDFRSEPGDTVFQVRLPLVSPMSVQEAQS